jgi:hypothetical protein
MMATLIAKPGRAVPMKLTELAAPRRTLKKRAADLLAYFDQPGASIGPPRRLTAGSNTCAARPWASET